MDVRNTNARQRAPGRSRGRAVIAATLATLLVPSFGAPALAAKGAKVEQAETPWPDVPPLQIERFTLGNGMRVVVQTDRSAPLVALGLMVDVGSRDELKGHSGLAHFFEHMMFQGSKYVGKMEHFNALEAVGADLNANTSSDRTYYYETLPKGALELALWLEHQRFSALAVNLPNVENQRQTVMEERRQRYDNQPYALSRMELIERLFDSWELGHSTIGSMDDLAAAPLEDFVDFWRRWYTPNNVVVALVGDISGEEARAVLERTLGTLERRAEVEKKPFAFEERKEHAYVHHVEQRGKMPAFHLAWKVPAAPAEDAYALDLLSEVLDGGRSSRLERKLGRETGLASRHFAGTYGRRDVDVFHVYVEMATEPLADVARAKQLIREAILDIAAKGVDPDELRRAKVAFEAGWVFGRESAESRAEVLCRYELYYGDARKVQAELGRYRAQTSADLQRVAARWLTWAAELEMDVLPTGVAPPADAGTKPKAIEKLEASMAAARAAAEKKAKAEAAAAEKKAKAEAAAAEKKAKAEAAAAAKDAKDGPQPTAEEAPKSGAPAADPPPPSPPPPPPTQPDAAGGGGQ